MKTADYGNFLTPCDFRRPIERRKHRKRCYRARGKVADLPKIK
ncbi:hypothetical protein [Muribaculum intestinale]|nr:hypothetical protein [Muribaculum intestinale]